MAASTPNKKPGLSLIEDEFWYAGPVSERKAEQVLTKQGEAGTFLVRDSLLPGVDYVLSVNGGKDIWHYDIKVWPTNECVFNNYTFTTLPDAITFYTENRLGLVYLNEPDEPIVAEPVISKAVGPHIKLAPTSTAHQPRATPVVLSPAILDPVRPKSAVSTDSNNECDAPSSRNAQINSSPHSLQNAWQMSGSGDNSPSIQSGGSPGPQHFTFNTTNFEEAVSSQSHSQTSGEVKQSYIEPASEIESVFVTTPELDNSVKDDSDHTEKRLPRTEELAGDDNKQEPVTVVDHIVSDTGAEYAVVNKIRNRQASPEISPRGPTDSTQSSPHLSSHSEASSACHTPTGALKSPKDKKVEQVDELMQLPSIGDKKRALEQKMKGEEAEEPKRKTKKAVPPPPPKRKIFTENSKADLPVDTKQEKEIGDKTTESVDGKPANNVVTSLVDPVKSSMKNTPPPTPKRLSIPESFQRHPEEDDAKSPQKGTSPSLHKRVVIPESLQARPPPPPMATHPGLAQKEAERQQQLKEAELEIPQPKKSKKRLSFLRKKNKDKDKDKRKSSTKDEPILLEDAEKLKQVQQQQESPEPVPNTNAPRRLSGVPTPAMSPISLSTSGGGAELESMFKFITKQEWRPEDEEGLIKAPTSENHSKNVTQSTPTKAPQIDEKVEREPTPSKDDSIEASTFAKPSVTITHSTPEKAPSTSETAREEESFPEDVVSTSELPIPVKSTASNTKKSTKPKDESKEIGLSTFGKPSVQISSIAPAQSLDTNESTNKKQTHRRDSSGDIGVSTFKPRGTHAVNPPASPTSTDLSPSPIPVMRSPMPQAPNSPPASTVSPIPALQSPESPKGYSQQVPSSPTTGSVPSSPSIDQPPVQQSPRSPTRRAPDTPTANSKTSPSPASDQPPNTFGPSQGDVTTSTINAAAKKTSPKPAKAINRGHVSMTAVPGFVITPSGSTPLTSSQLGPRTRSLVEVVPGLSKTSRTLPRTLPTMQETPTQSRDEVDYSQMVPGVRISAGPVGRRHTTAAGKAEEHRKNTNVSSIGPMNSKRIDKKKKKK